MEFEKVEIVYFLGIGGIGMSALARYFHHHKKTVLGYDKTRTGLTTELEMEGISIHYDDTILEIPHLLKVTPKEKVLVIYTPAIPHDSSEKNWFIDNGYTLYKRSQVLGLITDSLPTIAVAGTHGKTTTSSLAAHILKHSKTGCNAFLGGISANYKTNLLLGEKTDWTVVEADEFDRSFLTLSPTISTITSTDADHLDIYGDARHVIEGFQLFAEKIKPGGHLIIKQGLEIDIKKIPNECSVYFYSINEECDFFATNIRVENGKYHFDFNSPFGKVSDISLGQPGRHNIENAVAASAACLLAGVDISLIKAALNAFSGVARRFQYIISTPELTYIDDYAHHPSELEAAIKSTKELFPGKKITGIFQPHLFTRTRDFADEFAQSLDLLDECILLPIYPARELPIEGVTSAMLLGKMKTKRKVLVQKNDLIPFLSENKPEVLLSLGAGDIDIFVDQIRNLFA